MSVVSDPNSSHAGHLGSIRSIPAANTSDRDSSASGPPDKKSKRGCSIWKRQANARKITFQRRKRGVDLKWRKESGRRPTADPMRNSPTYVLSVGAAADPEDVIPCMPDTRSTCANTVFFALHMAYTTRSAWANPARGDMRAGMKFRDSSAPPPYPSRIGPSATARSSA